MTAADELAALREGLRKLVLELRQTLFQAKVGGESEMRGRQQAADEIERRFLQTQPEVVSAPEADARRAEEVRRWEPEAEE